MTGLTVVVGSANLDVVASVDRRPADGETVLGSALLETPGGKGLNQAVAAAAVSPTAFVGVLGDDEAGRLLLAELAARGVDTTCTTTAAERTGRALITVTPDGENSIVVLPLANELLTPLATSAALDALTPAVVLAQLEVPVSVVASVATWCRSHDVRFVLNPSPVAHLGADVLRNADPVIVNRGEAVALLTGLGQPPTDDDASRLAAALCHHTRSAVVTDGARGAALAQVGGPVHRVPAPVVRARDTTGAGDAFAGTLAGRLAQGASPIEAVADAVAVSAALVTVAREDR